METEHTNSWASCKYDELIAKQAAKVKKQAATAKELINARVRGSLGARSALHT